VSAYGQTNIGKYTHIFKKTIFSDGISRTLSAGCGGVFTDSTARAQCMILKHMEQWNLSITVTFEPTVCDLYIQHAGD